MDPSSAAGSPPDPVLSLPDGTRVKWLSGAPLPLNGDMPDDPGIFSTIGSYLVFGPLPQTTNHALLVLPQLPGSDPGTVPDNWEIPFDLQPALASTPAVPVPFALSAASDHGITFALEQVTPSAAGYILTGSVQTANPAMPDAGVFAPSLKITDVNGKDIPFEQLTPPDQNQAGRQLWSLLVRGSDFQWPLALRATAMQADFPTQASFQFDPGPFPVPEQVWTLDQDIQVGKYPLRIIGVQLSSALDGSGFAQYQIFMRSTSELLGASVMDLDHPAGVGMGGGEAGPGIFSAGLFYNGGLPAGPMHIGISKLYVLVNGSWQVDCLPPGH